MLTSSLLKHIDRITIFIVCLCIFIYMTFYINEADISVHTQKIVDINRGVKEYPPHFLFYFTINLFSGFSNNLKPILIATSIILSVITTSKYAITKHIIKSEIPSISKKFLILISLGLLFFFSIPDFYNVFTLKYFYLGRIVSTVWHNSTVIFVFPFALLLFWKQYKTLNKDHSTLQDILLLNLLVLLNILSKPSFIFVYLPVSFFLILHKYGILNFKRLLVNLTPVIFGGCLIITQYILIYLNNSGSIQDNTNQIILTTPFKFASLLIPYWYIPLSIGLSLALPICSIILYKGLLKYKPFKYALYLNIVGILIWAFIMESGSRMLHGNFIWQNVICSYLLFLTCTIYLLPIYQSNPKSKRIQFLKGVFILHVLSGFAYLAKIFIVGTYY